MVRTISRANLRLMPPSLESLCQLGAPILNQQPYQDKVNIVPRDSLSITELLRAGEFTLVQVPDTTQKAIRDLDSQRSHRQTDAEKAKMQ